MAINIVSSSETYLRDEILYFSRVDCEVLVAKEVSLEGYRMTFYACF